MNKRAVMLQVALFAVITLGCGYYMVTNVLGSQALGEPMRVTVRMQEAAGLSEGARVTYRGVEVGTVADVRISADGAGVRLGLDINRGTRIPADSEVAVTVNTPVGITHLDLRPRTREAPYLDGSSTLGPDDVTRPPPLERVLVDFMRLAESLPTKDLATLTEALSTGLRGLGPELTQLLDNSGTVLGQADERLRQLNDIAGDARVLMRSVDAGGGRIRELAKSMRELTGGLRDMEPAVTELMHRVPGPAKQVAELMAQSRSSVSTLLGNMVTTSRIVGVRTPALEQALSSLPRTLRELASIVDGDTANFYLIATQGPACYYKTDRRSPTETDPRKPRLDWHCPADAPNMQQRGAANAPRPDAVPAPRPDARRSPDQPRPRPAASTQSLPFNVDTAGSHRVLGPRSWSSVLLRGVK